MRIAEDCHSVMHACAVAHSFDCCHASSCPLSVHCAVHTLSAERHVADLHFLLCFAGNLAFPLLLVGGLFLLSRRSGGAGGMGGGPGGGPMQFGKSKAKFQMEPNTGITFDDVAGVDEAKQDFMEVCIPYTLNPSFFCVPL